MTLKENMKMIKRRKKRVNIRKCSTCKKVSYVSVAVFLYITVALVVEIFIIKKGGGISGFLTKSLKPYFFDTMDDIEKLILEMQYARTDELSVSSVPNAVSVTQSTVSGHPEGMKKDPPDRKKIAEANNQNFEKEENYVQESNNYFFWRIFINGFEYKYLISEEDDCPIEVRDMRIYLTTEGLEIFKTPLRDLDAQRFCKALQKFVLMWDIDDDSIAITLNDRTIGKFDYNIPSTNIPSWHEKITQRKEVTHYNSYTIMDALKMFILIHWFYIFLNVRRFFS